MPKLVQALHNRIVFAVKKGLTGYIPPETIIQEAYAEVLNIWRKYIKAYADTREINLYLKPFEKTELVATLSGPANEGTKTVTACHRYPIAAFVTATKKEVRILSIGQYQHIFNHPVKGPTADFPICKFENNTIYVAPKLDITVVHLAKPVKPVYAYAIQGEEYVYDDATSTDIEFDESIHDDIVNRVLANLGIQMRDGDLIQYSQQQKATEGV